MSDPSPEITDDRQADVETADATARLAASLAEPAAPPSESPPDPIELLYAKLPTYARGLLKIQVPVQVTLASQRKSIQEIIELGPGAIVKFEKTCDEPLELAIGDRAIAVGEVVKVGDKFGLRVGRLIS